MRSRMFALAAASLLALGFSEALAQYPPPIGSIVLQPSDRTPGVNRDASLTVTVQSESGVAAGNAACTAGVALQPGNDARVSPASFTTNASGNATLTVYTGSTAGQIKVLVSCGTLGASAVMDVQGAVAPRSGPPGPPNTGTGAAVPAGHGTDAWPWVLAIVVTVVGIGGITAGRRLSRG